jgi:hypothetical protein
VDGDGAGAAVAGHRGRHRANTGSATGELVNLSV